MMAWVRLGGPAIYRKAIVNTDLAEIGEATVMKEEADGEGLMTVMKEEADGEGLMTVMKDKADGERLVTVMKESRMDIIMNA